MIRQASWKESYPIHIDLVSGSVGLLGEILSSAHPVIVLLFVIKVVENRLTNTLGIFMGITMLSIWQ
jgi:hypothetical protein